MLSFHRERFGLAALITIYHYHPLPPITSRLNTRAVELRNFIPLGRVTVTLGYLG